MKILVGNKCDLKDQRQVSFQEGKAFADSLGMQFLETSARDKINIDEAFITLTKAILPTVPESRRGDDSRPRLTQTAPPSSPHTTEPTRTRRLAAAK